MLSGGPFEKSDVGTVKRNQQGVISTWELGAEGHPLPTCVSQGKRREGLPEPDKRCGYRSFQGMSIHRVKTPASQRDGGREAKEINILSPIPLPVLLPLFRPKWKSRAWEPVDVVHRHPFPGTQLGGEWRVIGRSKQKIPSRVVYWGKYYPKLIFLGLQN